MLWSFPKVLLELRYEIWNTKIQPAVGYFSLGENTNAFSKQNIRLPKAITTVTWNVMVLSSCTLFVCTNIVMYFDLFYSCFCHGWLETFPFFFSSCFLLAVCSVCKYCSAITLALNLLGLWARLKWSLDRVNRQRCPCASTSVANRKHHCSK